MKIETLSIPGVCLFHGHRCVDDRGEFRKVLGAGDTDALPLNVAEVGISCNDAAGTLRGLHYQAAPYEQAKTIWVSSGTIFDVVVDIRPGSSSYGQWLSVELDAEQDIALHMPRGVAHGFLTLAPHSIVNYLLDNDYSPTHARTLLWNDPTLAIGWPSSPSVVSDQDERGEPWPPRS